jgi:hypothetical protein
MTIEDFEKYDGKPPVKKSCTSSTCSPHTSHMGATEREPIVSRGLYGWNPYEYDEDDDYFRQIGNASVRCANRDYYGFPLDRPAEIVTTIIESGTQKEK